MTIRTTSATQPANVNLFALFADAAARHADRACLIVDGVPLLSQAEMLAETGRAAGVLHLLAAAR